MGKLIVNGEVLRATLLEELGEGLGLTGGVHFTSAFPHAVPGLLRGLAAGAPGLGQRARHGARRGRRPRPDAAVPPPRRQGTGCSDRKFVPCHARGITLVPLCITKVYSIPKCKP